MKRKKLFVICLVLSSLLILSSSVFAQEKPKNYVQGVTKDEIFIGGFYALTGPVAYGGLGQSQGAELYFNEVNAKGGIHGRRIKFVAEDDACTPIKGVASVNKLLAEKPFMLVGPTCSGVALAAIETIAKEGIPWFIYGVSTGKVTTPMRKNVFRAGAIPDDLQAKAVVDYDIHNMKARNIAILHDTSEYGKGGADGIVERLAEYGLKPVARESYAMGDTDFTTQILKLREAKPEVVHLYAYPKEAAIIARQAKELGLGAQIIGSAAVSVPSFLESAGDTAIGVLSVYPYPKLADSPAAEVVDFVNRLKANYRVTAGRPAYVDLLGYGGGMVVVEALKRAGKDLTWENIIHAFESIKNFDTGFIQPLTFSPTDHNGQRSTKLLVALPGKKWSVLAEDLFVRDKVEKIQ